MNDTHTTELQKNVEQSAALGKRNRRVALLLGGLVLFVLLTSVPFWLGIARIIGNQAG